MSAIRQPGKINESTTLIDLGMQGVAGVAAAYLIEGEKRCLVDAGTSSESPRLVKMLRELGAFPPDVIIITHAHFDHAQGVPHLRKEAAKQEKEIEVYASEDAIPLLADPAYNKVFGPGPYEEIRDVIPIADGDTLDLGGSTLRVYQVPGHCRDQIAVLDETNKCIFAGDALGYKVADNAFLPPFMPPSWDPDDFMSSIEKLRQVDYERLCLAHFGCVYGGEEKSILDEAVLTYERWWHLFERNADRLDDMDYLLGIVLEEINPEFAEPEFVSLKLKALYGLMTGWSRLVGKEPQPIGELMLRGILEWLVTGYSLYASQH